MTPPSGTKLSDSDSRLRSADDDGISEDRARLLVQRHENECRERGPLHDLSEKVDKMRMQQAAAGGVIALLLVLGPVVLGWWLSTRLPSPPQHRAGGESAFVPFARAEGKAP